MVLSAAEFGTTCNNLLISTSAFWKHFAKLRGIWFDTMNYDNICSSSKYCMPPCNHSPDVKLLNQLWKKLCKYILFNMISMDTKLTSLYAILWQKGLNAGEIALHTAKSHLLMILQMNLFTSIGYLSVWERRGHGENNGESKYLIHLSSLLCLAVITNRGRDAKDCRAREYNNS